MNTAAKFTAQADANRDGWSQLPDDSNPEFVFSLAATDVLAAAARGELDLLRLAREQLAARGLDSQGRWVGFDRARAHHGLAPKAAAKKAVR